MLLSIPLVIGRGLKDNVDRYSLICIPMMSKSLYISSSATTTALTEEELLPLRYGFYCVVVFRQRLWNITIFRDERE